MQFFYVKYVGKNQSLVKILYKKNTSNTKIGWKI